MRHLFLLTIMSIVSITASNSAFGLTCKATEYNNSSSSMESEEDPSVELKMTGDKETSHGEDSAYKVQVGVLPWNTSVFSASVYDKVRKVTVNLGGGFDQRNHLVVQLHSDAGDLSHGGPYITIHCDK